jgi:ABC-2 type transport system ATP-binding protein
VIACRNLQVTFRSKAGPVEALRGLDLDVPRGALYVLLGPNGAGKTTLMRCITGLVRPTGGSIEVLGGADGQERRRLARLGVLIENPGQYGRLDAREYLSFFASFYAIAEPQARIRELCALFGLELDGKPTGKLSQGNRQKLQLARSLLHRPELLLWDEPTDHLDPASQREVLSYLRRYLAESGATALVATHRLEQMEAVASHFGFLARGSLLASGERAAILEGTGEESARARLGFARAVRSEELAWLGTAFAARVMAVPGEPEAADISAPDLRRRMPEIISALVGHGLPLASAEPRRDSLADVYHRLVGD